MLTRTKPQEELSTRRCRKNTPKEEFRIKAIKDPDEMLDKTKTVTTIAR